MLHPSALFEKDVRRYQEYILNYGYCTLCNRELAQGENVFVGEKADGNISVACESCKNRINADAQHFVYHPKEYSVPKKDVLLWRYQDFPKFISLLDSGELYFTRADRFEDVFEGARGFNFQKAAIYDKLKQSLTLTVMSQLRAAGIGNPTDNDVENKLKEEFESWLVTQESKRREYFVSCWHANERESEAMWKLYITAKKQGVAIQTTMERLCYSIGKNGFEVGNVIYISYEKPLESDAEPIWYKRTAFSHENEVRAIFREVGTSKDGMPVMIDLDMLIERVYVSPSAPGWFADLVRRVMNKYGLDKPVEYSRLDEKPIY